MNSIGLKINKFTFYEQLMRGIIHRMFDHQQSVLHAYDGFSRAALPATGCVFQMQPKKFSGLEAP
jgi:hypothetical protein